MRLALILSIAAVGCAGAPPPVAAPVAEAPADAGPPKLLRVHLDTMMAGAGDEVVVQRREYLGWLAAHAAETPEPPTYVVKLDGERYWTLRPAASLDEMSAQNKIMAAADDTIRAAVGDATMEASSARLHARIAEHHNEIFRLSPELSRPAGSAPLASLDELQWIVIDDVSPQGDDAYEAALAAAATPGWRTSYWSAFGTGMRVHFLGGPTPLPAATVDDPAWGAACRSHTILAASNLSELATPGR